MVFAMTLTLFRLPAFPISEVATASFYPFRADVKDSSALKMLPPEASPRRPLLQPAGA